MSSRYFQGGKPKAAEKKPGERVPLPPVLDPEGDTRFTKPPRVLVRTHTRAAPTPKPAKKEPPKAGASARPTVRVRDIPTPPVTASPAARRRWEKVTGRKLPPAGTVRKPGPTGDEKTQLNPVELAEAKRVGVHPTIAMTALKATAHPLTDLSRQALGEKPLNVGGAVSDVANIASNFVPVGKAAGLLGGLRGLGKLKAAAKAEPIFGDAAKAVEPIAEDAAALRGAVSGKPAKATLKAMTPTEKAVAKLDNPNLGKSVRQLQKEQKLLYSQERGRRAAAAEAHLNNQALAPDERIRLAKHELRGELPKIKFQGFTELSDEAVTAMQKHILDHETLMPFQKITASTAMTNALTGKLPTPSELNLLEHVFGKDTTKGLGAIAKHPIKDTILSVLNIPRSIMASVDLSAPFRQGLVVATRHPQIFARNFKPMVKAFGSEKVYEAVLDDIAARPSFPLMMEAKLSLTNLGHAIGEREEQFASDIAEKLTGGKLSPIRASGRAYTGFLDKTRADVFDHLIERAHAQGLNVHDPTFLRSLGTYINSATGRGDLGAFQEAGKVLNAVFFSPRLLASRLNFLNPLYYKRLDPFARKEALRSAVQLAGTLSTLLTLASQIPGVKVVTDPRNSDWGKIRLGNTRIDIAGGFQQHLRLFAQLATGVAISSTSGKKMSLTAGQFGKPTRLDLFLRFFEGKESPVASFATDFMRNSNQIGEPFDLRTEVTQRMLPLLAQDSYELYKQKDGGMNGLAAAFGGYAVGAFGIGMQTYGPRPSTAVSKKPQSYFSPSSSGGSSYFSPSPSGGSGYFGSP